jgi:hypothetical protein
MTTVLISLAKLEKMNRYSAAVAQVWLGFVFQKDFTPSQVNEWMGIVLFDLTTLSFKLCLHKHHAYLGSSS